MEKTLKEGSDEIANMELLTETLYKTEDTDNEKTNKENDKKGL